MNTTIQQCPVCYRDIDQHDDSDREKCWRVSERREHRRQIELNLISVGAVPAEVFNMTFAGSAPAVEGRDPSTWTATRSFIRSEDLFLVLHGPCGNGKTFAACAVLNQAIDTAVSRGRTISAAFIVATEFVRTMRRFDPGAILTIWKNANLLIIDDLDKPAWDRRDIAALWEVLDARQRRGLKSVVTTNLRPSDFRSVFSANENLAIFDSLRQRMTPRMVIEFGGESLREISTFQRAIQEER